MYPASAAYQAAVTASGHEAIGGIDLLDASGMLVRELVVDSGAVTEDASASVRRTLDASIVDDGGLLPLDSSPLFPGALLRPWRGVRFPGGGEERIPLGVLVAGKPEADLEAGTISLSADDRSGPVALARLVDPWPVAKNTWLSDVVTELLLDRLPGCPAVALAAADVQITADTMLPFGADSDPWQALVSTTTDSPGLVHSAGRRLWFDADGVPTIYDLAGSPSPVQVDGSRLVLAGHAAIDPEQTYGGVCVTSNVFGDDDPLRAVAWDPTPINPMFARRVYFAQMDALDTQGAVDSAAATLLARVTGIKGQASCAMPPDAARQAGDVLSISGGPLTGLFEIARIVTPLGAGLQQVDFVERVI